MGSFLRDIMQLHYLFIMNEIVEETVSSYYKNDDPHNISNKYESKKCELSGEKWDIIDLVNDIARSVERVIPSSRRAKETTHLARCTATTDNMP